ncbi:phage tail protein [Acinetobacter bohemicus]|uniref:phage tail fiber protein n=1 Tax=Acinetobacter sp. S4397-1 TaxID=2972915 RepID=UPI00209AF715|nr:phage tail protein [Acinetobacter sp. S4397-1]MCO8044994.1 phage tail protein [Acinetobacter sp. S4397-1]
MAKQTINPGTAPTGAGGDTFRSGSAKLQANDDEIYSQLGATAQGVLPAALPVNKGGTGATSAGVARTNLGLGTAATATLTISPTDQTAGRVMKVGDFGVGTSSMSVTPVPLKPEDTIPNSFLRLTGGDSTGHGAGVGEKIGLPLAGTYAALNLAVSPAHAHLLIAAQNVHQNIYHGSLISNIGSSTTKRFFKILDDQNTAVDSNGFVKAASPIIELYADRIELNDEAQEQKITFEKVGTGNYLIKGSSGFAQEGWYIETPKDANGNVLFSVIYATLENGDISVKTYKKKFDFETVSIVADLDNPVDITENRWIDLRLQELPQPEIEEPESIAPPEFQPTGLAEAVATVMESHHDSEQ